MVSIEKPEEKRTNPVWLSDPNRSQRHCQRDKAFGGMLGGDKACPYSDYLMRFGDLEDLSRRGMVTGRRLSGSPFMHCVRLWHHPLIGALPR